MSTPIVEMVIVGYTPLWKKWPLTQDMSYNDILSQRSDTLYHTTKGDVVIRTRHYPIHRGYVIAGHLETPVKHPFINNLLPPPHKVMDAMLRDLRDIANDGVTICLWEHAYQCYPYVAQHLRNIFKHSIIVHADDCPGATEIKTQPVARHFDSAIHGNIIWKLDGSKTEDLYKGWGVTDTHYLTLSVTGGFMPGLADWMKEPDVKDAKDAGVGSGIAPLRQEGVPSTGKSFDIDRRVAQLRAKAYTFDLAFVGGKLGQFRPKLNEPGTTAAFRAAGLRTKIAGIGMRDGALLPRIPATLGGPVAQLYINSFSTLNLQFIGLMGTRPYDAWASGTLLLQWDPVGEMAEVGAQDGVHFVGYDGTIVDLIAKVKYYQAHMDETESIVRAGLELGSELPKKHSMCKALERILVKYKDKIGWGC